MGVGWVGFSFISMDELRTALSEDSVLEAGEIEDIIAEVDLDNVSISSLHTVSAGGGGGGGMEGSGEAWVYLRGGKVMSGYVRLCFS